MKKNTVGHSIPSQAQSQIVCTFYDINQMKGDLLSKEKSLIHTQLNDETTIIVKIALYSIAVVE